MARPLSNRSNRGQEQFVRALTSAYSTGFRISNPDISVQSDPDLFEVAMRDSVVAKAIETRLRSIAHTDWTIVPAGKTEEDQRLAAIVDDAVRAHLKGFTAARKVHAKSVIVGRGFSRIHGSRRSRRIDGLPSMKWWVPTGLKDVDERRVRWAHEEDNSVRMQLYQVGPPGQWEFLKHETDYVKTTFSNEESRLGYGRGLMEAIYSYLFFKEKLILNGVRAAERWATGMISATISRAGLSREDQDLETVQAAWEDVLKDASHRGVVTMLDGDKVEFHEMSTQGGQMVRDWVDYLDQGITGLILGSVLPFGGGGDVGSNARAETESDVSEALIQYDRDQIFEDYTRDLIGLFVTLNWPILNELGLGDARNPRFEVSHTKFDDPEQQMRIITAAGEQGIKLKLSEVHEQIGFTQPGPGDEVFEGVQQSSGFQLPGLDGIDAEAD